MNGELVKRQDRWDLYAEDGSKIGSSAKNPMNKLSLKNCQAIENGYDLDEIRKLADEDFECELGDGPTTNESVNSMIKKSNADGAEWGFKKALEIIGDKKFGVNEVVELCKILISNPFEKCGKTYQELTDSYIQSLQQTEWDVEIVTEKFFKVEGDNGITIYAEAMEEFDERNDYKLDKDGCLILKRNSYVEKN